MDSLAIFGLFAVTAMVVCYTLENRSPWFILAFSGACVLGSSYGFLQGAWPFGLVEGVWALIAVRRWWQVKPGPGQVTPSSQVSTGNIQEEGGKGSPEDLVLAILRKVGKAKRHDLLPQVGLSKSSLGRLLDQMETRGLVVQVGERKAAYYRLPDSIPNP